MTLLHSETLANGVNLRVIQSTRGFVEIHADTYGPFEVVFRGSIDDARQEYRTAKQREAHCRVK